MGVRASGAPLLQDSSPGDGPFVGFPASHVHSWGDFILKRRCGYVAQRVGEASHPCPGGKAAQQRKQMEAPLQAVLGEGAAIRLLVMLFSLLIGTQSGIAGLQHLLRSNGLLAPGLMSILPGRLPLNQSACRESLRVGMHRHLWRTSLPIFQGSNRFGV